MTFDPSQQYLCVTAPCGPYTNPRAASRPPTAPAGFGTVEVGRSMFNPAPSVYELALANAVQYDPRQFEYEERASAQAAAVARLPTFTIPDTEMQEIDAALAERDARAERIEQLAEFTETIHPDRLLDIAGNIAEGRYATVPLPPVAPPVAVIEAPYTPPPAPAQSGIVRSPAIGPPVFLGSLVPAAGEVEPDIYEAEPEEEPMGDLSHILGYVSDAAAIYQSFQPPPQIQAAPVAAGYEGSISDWVDGPADWLAPAATTTSLPNGGAVMAGYTGGCISNRDRRIAAASGVSPEAVDKVLHYARQGRRRRRRMLTKSDIGDISTMKSILGNGEAFKMWLAKATR